MDYGVGHPHHTKGRGRPHHGGGAGGQDSHFVSSGAGGQGGPAPPAPATSTAGWYRTDPGRRVHKRKRTDGPAHHAGLLAAHWPCVHCQLFNSAVLERLAACRV